MSSALEINEKKLQPIREVVDSVSYSRDYVTRLAREGKIVASYIGRQWFVDFDSLKQYEESMTIEQEIRKRRLSAERKRERDLFEEKEARQTLRLKQVRKLPVQAAVIAIAILGVGVLGGWVAEQTFSVSTFAQRVVNEWQPAQVPASAPAAGTEEAPIEAHWSSAVAAEVSSQTVDSLEVEDAVRGVLLLPSGATTTADITQLFSDRVVIVELENGVSAVARIDEAGDVVEPAVPFLEVPVRINR